MNPAIITLLFLAFAIVMFVSEKIPLGLTSMIVCVGLIVTGVLGWKDAFAGFIDSNVILFVAMFVVGGALFETGMANKIGGLVTKFAKSERSLIVGILFYATIGFRLLPNHDVQDEGGAFDTEKDFSDVPKWKQILSLVILVGTLIGMPANTMVLGVGGYKFKDYVKSGLPLIVIATIVSMVSLPIAFPFFP